jgi:enoyl-CoA hydratase/carnithine racemase
VSLQAGAVPAPVHTEDRNGVVLLTIAKPVLAVATLEAIEAALREPVAHDTPVVLLSAHPRIFLAGADLAEIATLDRWTSGPYARRGRSLMRTLSSHPKPVVAAVHGTCAGGGVDLVLSCDAVVVGPGASLQHPGVRRGLITGWSGTHTVPSRLGPQGAAPLISGTAFDPAGLPGGFRASGDLVAAAVAEARRLDAFHPSRLELWRSFRCGNFVDSFRARMVHNVEDWNQSG